jgi:enterochelin esterase-like enzyme
VDDYAVLHAEDRLRAAPLTPEDFLGWVKPERLSAMNRSLAARPYTGAILVCPYLPDSLHGARMVEEGRALAHFVVDELLPRVARETPATGTPETTAVDGVSLGGRASLLVGLLRPEAFHAVGALQPAVDDEEIGPITNLAQVAQTKNPGLVIRLLSSDGDYFLAPTAGLHETFGARSVKSLLSLVVGPHSYEFNRGPGALEMLFFHDRLFHGLTEP